MFYGCGFCIYRIIFYVYWKFVRQIRAEKIYVKSNRNMCTFIVKYNLTNINLLFLYPFHIQKSILPKPLIYRLFNF